MNYKDVVNYLESLTIMPKTMPGLEKIRQSVVEKPWFKNLDPKKIITIAGTNGKGTTAAALEALLTSAGQKVGLYTSPHLVTTAERIRVNGQMISKQAFVDLFLENRPLIEKYELSHFESLTLMAADYFFQQNLDYVIFEVGLGGTYDATNVFPNHFAVITKIGVDHENILGNNLVDIARNKFGIIKNNSVVIHHRMDDSLKKLVNEFQVQTGSRWILGENQTRAFETNLIGHRAKENISTAIEVFETLGFDFEKNKTALMHINWPGRMQKIEWPGLQSPTYLSGDHNPQGVASLIEILKSYDYQHLHLIVGIGMDKACDEMLHALLSLPRVKLYLTETPFKGRPVNQYPAFALEKAVSRDSRVENILNHLEARSDDMVVVTGSLYLVGAVLSNL